MSIDKIRREHWRIAILRLLEQGDGYSANESILTDALPFYGVTPSRDQVATELAWLKDQGLISLSDNSGTNVAMLTNRGLDVARGRAAVPGVKRPSPDAIMASAVAAAQSILKG